MLLGISDRPAIVHSFTSWLPPQIRRLVIFVELVNILQTLRKRTAQEQTLAKASIYINSVCYIVSSSLSFLVNY